MDAEAVRWVTTALRDCTPPHIPLPFTEVLAARFLKRQTPTAAASLRMVDGYRGYIQVSKWGPFDAWSYQWQRLDGGPLYWNGSAWVRWIQGENEEQLQMAL